MRVSVITPSRRSVSCVITAFLLVWLFSTAAVADKPTSVTLEGKVYGAQSDEVGPIGGGAGYTRIITQGDLVATTLDELIDALAKAKPGQVVFIPGNTEIDLTARVYIEKLVLEIPGGVTLASNRGEDGSAGALICSDALGYPVRPFDANGVNFEAKPLIDTLGPNVRVTGLRIRGPNPKRYLDHHRRAFSKNLPDGMRGGRAYYYKFPISKGLQTVHSGLEVDNCDLSAFSQSSVFLISGEDHHIHHNFIHHCQYQGLGYGVSHDKASSLIERNLFDWNRHSIAGTGRIGCSYIARHNVELGTSLAHCFDVHGAGGHHEDGAPIAGTAIRICNNTFRAPTIPIYIRGVPQDKCEVFQNWFPRHEGPDQAVRHGKNTVVRDNAYGTEPAKVIP